MSAIFGLFNLSGEPVANTSLERMNAALAAHGPDGHVIWSQANVGLGLRLMRVTPEDQFERQPLASADGQRVLVSDARIDNRPELMREMGIAPAQARDMPDSAFILRAYEKWGEDCGADALHFVSRQILDHDDVAIRQAWCQDFIDIDPEGFAVHRLSKTKGATRPSQRSAAVKVVVFQCPRGALPINRRPRRHRGRDLYAARAQRRTVDVRRIGQQLQTNRVWL